MTWSLPDPSLATFVLEIERTLTRLRQARRRLAFVDSESGSLEENSHSLSPTTRDHHSPINEETIYSSVGSTEFSLSDSGDTDMANPPRRITLKEAGAPDFDLQPLQILHGADEAEVLVFAFPFSLEGKVKDWFYTQMEEVRSNWDLLRKEFLEKFYPPQKTDKLRREISCIVQRDVETLYEYWERFKKLLETCPHH
ncbi:hypothetical protein AHAS_Ahas19G0181600 [Arachis hypogaea]